MKDFDLLTCTNFDSAMNLKRNGKKNTTCQNQLNLMHSHSFHWEKNLPQMLGKYMVLKYWIHCQ